MAKNYNGPNKKQQLDDGFDVEEDVIVVGDPAPLGGSNFLVSAVMMLKRQKQDLQSEVQALKERVALLESQNAAFIDVSARRLLLKNS